MASVNAGYNDYSNPQIALQLSQNAPTILSKPSIAPSSILSSFLGAVESPEDWSELEQTFYACLRAKDDESAHKCLERLSSRFGADNERLIAMWGLYKEATANGEEELRAILQEYNQVLEQNPMNVQVHKRRVTLIRSLGRPADAIASLVQFLDSFPTDTEAWCELSDLYHAQGLLTQAIFCLEEALLTVPNAWNLQARLGELNFLASRSNSDGSDASLKHTVEAIRRFSRSIELCDDYLRGYYGLKVVTHDILNTQNAGKIGDVMSVDTIQKLDTLATGKLKGLIAKWSSKNALASNESEMIAAQALLDRQS